MADMDRCLGCEAKEQLREQVTQQDGDAKGVRVFLTPNPRFIPEEGDDGK